MLSTLHWFLMTALLAGSLSLLAIVAPEKRKWKVLALGVTALFLPMSYLTANDLLSRPKPFQQELLREHLNDAVVLSSRIRDGEDIYIWLQVKGLEEPRAYRLPWSEETAVQLHKAQSEADEHGTETTLKMPEGELLDSTAPMFEVTTPPAPPPKTVE